MGLAIMKQGLCHTNAEKHALGTFALVFISVLLWRRFLARACGRGTQRRIKAGETVCVEGCFINFFFWGGGGSHLWEEFPPPQIKDCRQDLLRGEISIGSEDDDGGEEIRRDRREERALLRQIRLGRVVVVGVGVFLAAVVRGRHVRAAADGAAGHLLAGERSLLRPVDPRHAYEQIRGAQSTTRCAALPAAS